MGREAKKQTGLSREVKPTQQQAKMKTSHPTRLECRIPAALLVIMDFSKSEDRLPLGLGGDKKG